MSTAVTVVAGQNNGSGSETAYSALVKADDGGGARVGIGYYVSAPYDGTHSSGGAYALTQYGLYVDNLYGYYGENASDTYGVYAAGGFQNYFAGNVGIGTIHPGYALDVNGAIHASGGVVFPDGSVQTIAFNPANCGADYAESVAVTGARTNYAPGDILVIDPKAPGKFLKSNESYSTLVAGIYSTKPGFVGRQHPEDAKSKATEVPMAMVGRVPTKVSAENGPIQVGDLLVSSSTLGYAMKGTDHSKMLGAIVGKAMGSLDSGKGVIEVLVTLQ